MSLPWIVGFLVWVGLMARAVWAIAQAPLPERSEYNASMHNGGQWEPNVRSRVADSQSVGARTG
ncbi:MAG: hypothetical protein HY826_03280 [Actinobacteria bacterium]|nr:hypothetical protein [Actinomycetota bacterium]